MELVGHVAGMGTIIYAYMTLDKKPEREGSLICI
jgi:hypothetical protein